MTTAIVFTRSARSHSGQQYLAGMVAGFPPDEAAAIVAAGHAVFRDVQPTPHEGSPSEVVDSSTTPVVETMAVPEITITAVGTVGLPPAPTKAKKGKTS